MNSTDLAARDTLADLVNRHRRSSSVSASFIFVAAIVGCGGIAVIDDGAGGSGASASTGGLTTGKSTGSKSNNGTAGIGSTAGPGQSGVVASTGQVVASTAVVSVVASTGLDAVTTGSGPLLPCELECQDDPGCNSDPPFPGGQCGQCVFNEAMNIGSSSCAITAATSPQCQNDAECSDFINCLFTSGDIQACAGMNPGGVQTLLTQVFASCARCGQCPTCSECCVTGN